MYSQPLKIAVYNLVKSMNSNEKRRFTQQIGAASKGTPPRYYLVFRSIVEMQDFDFEELQQKHPQIKAQQDWTQVFRQLQANILKTLRFMRNDDNIEFQLRQLLDEIQILFERNILDACMRTIKKGKRLARQHDLFIPYLEILNWERRLQRRLGPQGKSPDDSSLEIEEDRDAVRRIVAEREAIGLYHRIYLRQVPDPNAPGFQEEFQAVLEQREYHTFWAKILLNFTKTHFKDADQLEIARENYEYWQENPWQIRQHPDRYFGAISIYFRTLIASESTEEDYRQVLEEIRQNVPVDIVPSLPPQITNMELVMHMNLGRKERTLEAAERLRLELQHPKTKDIATHFRHSFYLNLGMAFFLTHQPHQSLPYLKTIWDQKRSSPTFYSLNASLWELIVRVETESDEIDVRYTAILRYWRSQPQLPPLAIPVIHLLYRIAGKHWAKEKEAEWKKFYDQYHSEFPSDANHAIQDILTWISSKANGTAFIPM